MLIHTNLQVLVALLPTVVAAVLNLAVWEATAILLLLLQLQADTVVILLVGLAATLHMAVLAMPRVASQAVTHLQVDMVVASLVDIPEAILAGSLQIHMAVMQAMHMLVARLAAILVAILLQVVPLADSRLLALVVLLLASGVLGLTECHRASVIILAGSRSSLLSSKIDQPTILQINPNGFTAGQETRTQNLLQI